MEKELTGIRENTEPVGILGITALIAFFAYLFGIYHVYHVTSHWHLIADFSKLAKEVIGCVAGAFAAIIGLPLMFVAAHAMRWAAIAGIIYLLFQGIASFYHVAVR